VPGLRAQVAPDGRKVLIHVSNFRPVKRPGAVVEVFARVRKQVSATLLMVGDGPESAEASRLARALGVAADVQFLGIQEQVVPLLSVADVFILPSAQESFGLAALEAMACDVPVIAARVGGLPEVIEDGTNGFLHAPDDLDGMAASAVRLLTDEPFRQQMAAAARRTAHDRYCDAQIVPLYETFYQQTAALSARRYTPN
jgi:L-malate glycosyltransferase